MFFKQVTILINNIEPMRPLFVKLKISATASNDFPIQFNLRCFKILKTNETEIKTDKILLRKPAI